MANDLERGERQNCDCHCQRDYRVERRAGLSNLYNQDGCYDGDGCKRKNASQCHGNNYNASRAKRLANAIRYSHFRKMRSGAILPFGTQGVGLPRRYWGRLHSSPVCTATSRISIVAMQRHKNVQFYRLRGVGGWPRNPRIASGVKPRFLMRFGFEGPFCICCRT